MTTPSDRDYARSLDAEDPLAELRDDFNIPVRDGESVTYLCGNSLGLQPRDARQAVVDELDDWADLAVDGHFSGEHPWSSFHEPLADPMADIVGADSTDEVVLMNTLTTNLHLMMVSFYRPTPERHKILIEGGAFPSDRYAVASQADFHGYDPEEALVEVDPKDGNECLSSEAICDVLRERGDEIALVMLGGVNYYSGQVFDMGKIVETAREVGCVVGLDLAHAVGNVELDLHEWGADFAVWCTYKYLNGGPGAIAGAFVHERHAERFDLPRFTGWWGNDPDTRFDMKPNFEPQRGAGGWQLSNAPILSMAPLRASLEMFQSAGMATIRQQSIRMTEYLLDLLDQLPDRPFDVITPREPSRRGCQISLKGPEGTRELFETLRDNHVVCDYRKPRVIRLAPAPLYNQFEELWQVYDLLRSTLDGS